MQKYMSGLENRMPPEMGISGEQGTLQLDELLRRSIGKKFDRNQIASLIGNDISAEDLNSIMDKLETARDEWNINAKEYGKAMAICSAGEFGDSLSKENFISLQCNQRFMSSESAMGLFRASDMFSSHTRRQSAMNMIKKALRTINERDVIDDGKEV